MQKYSILFRIGLFSSFLIGGIISFNSRVIDYKNEIEVAGLDYSIDKEDLNIKEEDNSNKNNTETQKSDLIADDTYKLDVTDQVGYARQTSTMNFIHSKTPKAPSTTSQTTTSDKTSTDNKDSNNTDTSKIVKTRNINEGEEFDITLSFYGDTAEENGGFAGLAASGETLEYGIIASNNFEIGTKIYIEELGDTFVVKDTGNSDVLKLLSDGSIKIDVFIPRNEGEIDRDYKARLFQLGLKKTTGYIVG